jgi:SAM-dependent methyltransferase
MAKQVDKAHYGFSTYVDKLRWASLWHQLDEVMSQKPSSVLEVGPGPGLFKAAATALGLHVETMDVDSELNPDHICSALKMPFEEGSFDVVCAFQMLEHMPFEQSLEAAREMSRVARKAVIVSLPDAKRCIPVSVRLPTIGSIYWHIPRPSLRTGTHQFNGQHYWEVNKAGNKLRRVSDALQKVTRKPLRKTFRVPEHPYHRFFVFGD